MARRKTKNTEPRAFNFNLHLACGTDELRPCMQYIHFIDSFAYATDAHVMVKVPLGKFINEDCLKCKLSELNGKSIHSKAFQIIMRSKGTHEVGAEGVAVNDGYGHHFYSFYSQENFATSLPNHEEVFKSFENKPLSRIAFNPSKIEQLSKTMIRVGDYSKHAALRLDFDTDRRAIHVRVECGPNIDIRDYEGVLGLLMPVMIEE